VTTKRDQLRELDDDILWCRTSAYRHSWEDFIPLEPKNFDVKPDLQLRCTRCGTQKYLWMDHEGNYSYTPHYIYPPGYRLKGLYRGDRLTAAELRAEVIKRQRKTNKKGLRAV
jgi:hypothetical protein